MRDDRMGMPDALALIDRWNTKTGLCCSHSCEMRRKEILSKAMSMR